VDVVEERFGLRAPDPYRWMEGGANAEFDAWLRSQGAYAAAYLARLPGRDNLYRRLRELGLGTSTPYGLQLAGGRAFYFVLAEGEQLPRLCTRGPDGKERTLVDPTSKGAKDSHSSINNFSPSPDGTLVAYNLSSGGSEVSAIHVLVVATGKELPDVIERIWGEFPASWLASGKGFFYTQMAGAAANADPMLNMRAFLHQLGQPVAKDTVVLTGAGSATMALAPEEFPGIGTQPDTDWLVASAGGAHANARFAVAPRAGLDTSGGAATNWRSVATYDDDVENVVIHGDRLYLQTYKNASNRRVVSVPLADPDLSKARVEMAEDPDAPIVSIAGARDGLYVRQRVLGRARVWRLPWNARAAVTVPLPMEGWVADLVTDPLRDGASFVLNTWTAPDTYYRYLPSSGKAEPMGIATTTSADTSGIVAEEVEAVSADGTRVPLSILHRKDLVLDGSRPTLLRGYGAYGISASPSFSTERLAWLERGGVSAIAHVRGGGEKGERWHIEGSHEHKMNGIRDLIACAQYLVDKKYTSSSRLFVGGGSAGGILVGRALAERPDLFAAAHIAVGMVNPVRLLAAENGANQKVEFGDPDSEVGFRTLLEVDPYQHVSPGTAYPAVIFTVGLNDRRVAPWMTGKMAARLQTATTSGKPVLVRIDPDSGHGIGSSRDQEYAEIADVWSFFLAVGGDPAFVPK
jgi:prolyl oligopeptidase